jgi:hypothetical protein
MPNTGLVTVATAAAAASAAPQILQVPFTAVKPGSPKNVCVQIFENKVKKL